jgi:hypothetical protein
VVVERDVWGVTAGHVLLHRPDNSVEPPVPTFVIYIQCGSMIKPVNDWSYMVIHA